MPKLHNAGGCKCCTPCPRKACFTIAACGAAISVSWTITGPGGSWSGSGVTPVTACTPAGVGAGTYSIAVSPGDPGFASGSGSVTAPSTDCSTHTAHIDLSYTGSGCCAITSISGTSGSCAIGECLVDSSSLTLTSTANGTTTLARNPSNPCEWTGSFPGGFTIDFFLDTYSGFTSGTDWALSYGGTFFGACSAASRSCNPFTIVYNNGAFDTITISQ